MNTKNQVLNQLKELLNKKEFFYQDDFETVTSLLIDNNLEDVYSAAYEYSQIIDHEYAVAYLEDESTDHTDPIEKAFYWIHINRIADYYFLDNYGHLNDITTEYKEYIEYAIEEIERN
jgi:hypothetical protein